MLGITTQQISDFFYIQNMSAQLPSTIPNLAQMSIPNYLISPSWFVSLTDYLANNMWSIACSFLVTSSALHTVVWNDYLLIFWQICHILLPKSWDSSANNQKWLIIKVSSHSAKPSHFLLIVYSLKSRLKRFVCDFLQIQTWQNEGAIHISNYWLCFKYRLWCLICSKNDR